MASGTAYRCKNLHLDVLHFFPDPIKFKSTGKLYQAPPSKASKTRRRSKALITRLPLEILHLILLNLDLTSLGMLRRVDTTSRRLVESLPAYRLLRKHAPYTLCLMDATRCSSHFPIQWIFTEFCHPWCRTCGEFGPYLYLPTVSRSCYKCNYLRPEYQVAPVTDVCLHFGLTQKDVKSLPITYNILPPKRRLVDITQAKALGRQLHGSYKAMRQEYQRRRKELEENYQQRVQKWKRQKQQGKSARCPWRQPIPTTLGMNGETSWRMQATVTFPYWDRRTQTLEPGTFCRACTYHWEEGKAKDWRRMETVFHPHPPSREAYFRAFLEAELPQHFLHCAAVKANYNFREILLTRTGPRREGTDFVVAPKKIIAG
ncbi:hypothetical protein Aspvir_001881 [Aspergillus viridinutans]|uniref:F-box domain-containing protein n=1 Tax=Aspergillus viridinutans TaxID=75553 RepID=A0A9P3F9Q2_ASPVI|nr:uncharacterized protein Aspvir_001881 [Aspergillus viridinutans]GIK06236.1 hypothetical protein Aspvir_001881 [Aspergillus viridinutans]